MAPYGYLLGWSTYTGYFVAFLIGIGFGVFLEQAGFGNAKKLAHQFFFKDMTVFKVMFTAIITAMTGLLLLQAIGRLDMEMVYLNPSYLWPGVVGGLIMGVGFAVGGYCPGTGIVGLATLKVDAFFNILGAALGMILFSEMYVWVESFMTSGDLGYRFTLSQWLGISPGLVGAAVIAIALAGFWGSEWVEKKWGHA